jgi:Sortase domain
VTDERAASRRGTWALVAVLVAAAGTAAGVAVLAGGPATARGLAFGPPLGAAAPSASSSGAVVGASPVVVPSAGVPGAGTAIGAAPAAPVGSPHDLAVTGFRPTRLLLPGGRSASVTAVGLHDDGSLVVPEDPQVVGWWSGGSRPGEPFGSVVVAGHVDSASRGVGVLAALPTVHAGQVVELAAGRRSARYTVVSAGLVPQTLLSGFSGLFSGSGDPQLVLVTCGGPFDPVRHRYADNYVVVARATS